MRNVRGVLAMCLAVGAGSWSLSAQAQETEGALQLGLGTSVFSYSSASLEAEAQGVTQDLDISTTRWGLSDTQATLELGYGLSDMIVLGGFAQLGGASTTTEIGATESEESSFSLVIGPKIDFMFSPGQTVRPFVGAALGLSSSSTEAGTAETSTTALQLLGRVGIRAFLADGFSLDPALTLGWASLLSGDLDLGVADADLSGSAFNIGVAVGFSGWL